MSGTNNVRNKGREKVMSSKKEENFARAGPQMIELLAQNHFCNLKKL